jgi:hypothetical protein
MNLHPCPFCGGTPECRRVGNDRTRLRSIIVRCPTCRVERTDSGIRTGFDWLEGVAEKNWNQRPVPMKSAPL